MDRIQAYTFIKTSFLLVLFIFFIPLLAHGKDCITHYDHGQINWTTGKITAMGNATPSGNTEKEIESMPGSARADANRNLIQILKQIKISHAMTIGQYAAANDIIMGGIEKTARDAVTILQTYTSAMDLQVTVVMDLPGGFLQLVLPEDICQISLINQENKQKPYIPSQDNSRDYTGLIIDADSLMTEPVLYPVIIDENGREIYSSRFISREFAVQFGVCTYEKDIKTAMKRKRLGDNPLVVRSIRKPRHNTAFLVISAADAKKLEKLRERHEFLKECRVSIVCNFPSIH